MPTTTELRLRLEGLRRLADNPAAYPAERALAAEHAEALARLLAEHSETADSLQEPDWPFDQFTFAVRNVGGYGVARREAVQSIVRACDCSWRHGYRDVRALDLEISGLQPIVIHLRESLPAIVERMDRDAAAWRLRYRTWLAGLDATDHDPRWRTSMCRSWTKDFYEAWGREYALRLWSLQRLEIAPTRAEGPSDAGAKAAASSGQSPIESASLANAVLEAEPLAEAAAVVRHATGRPWWRDAAAVLAADDRRAIARAAERDARLQPEASPEVGRPGTGAAITPPGEALR